MKKLIISLLVVITFSLFGMGYVKPEGTGFITCDHW